MKFKTAYDKNENKGTVFTSIIKDYNLIQKEDGCLDLVECGEHDTKDEINSYKEDCDINLLIAKYLNGDTTTGIGTPFEGTDLTNIETDINTAYQKMEELKTNPLFDEFLRSDVKINNKNIYDKFTEFINNKAKAEKTKTEEKKEETKINND